MSGDKLKDNLRLFAAFGLSAGLLTLIQVPFGLGWLAWVCLVPFIFICGPKSPKWRLVWISYIVSLVYWLGNLYWIALVTIPAYVLFCMFLGLYWPLLALCIRYCRKRGFSLLLTAGVLICGAEAWQGILLTGFSWRLLGHSQYANLTLIQISDIFGALGVSFIVAMVNGFIAEIFIDAKEVKKSQRAYILKTSILVCVIACTVVYGRWRIGQSDEFIEAGPVVGSVQPNVPSNVKELAESGGVILADLIKSGQKCFAAGAELVAWPETMVLATLNKDFLEIRNPQSQSRKFHDLISEFVKDRGYVLTGAHTAVVGTVDLQYVITDKFNSAFLYQPDGQQYGKRYDKIHLIPFGEFIPFKDSIPFLYELVIKLSPYSCDYHLTHGREHTAFEIVSNGKSYRFGVPICYEDTDPRVIRQMTFDAKSGKRIHWLVNISNDGWYVRFRDNKVLPSVELSQRTAISVFRAVENRVSILRSVNTGISCIIDPLGSITDGYLAGNLPEQAMARQGMAGWFTDRITIDKRVTFYSKYGQLLDFIYAAGIIIVIIAGILEKVLKNKSNK